MASPVDLYSYQEPILFLATAGIVVPLFLACASARSSASWRRRPPRTLWPRPSGARLSLARLGHPDPSGANVPSGRSRGRLPALHHRHRALLAEAAHPAAARVRLRIPPGRHQRHRPGRAGLPPGRDDHGRGSHRPGLRPLVHGHRRAGACRAEAVEHADGPGQLLGPVVPGPGRRADPLRHRGLRHDRSPAHRRRPSASRFSRLPSRSRSSSGSGASCCAPCSSSSRPPRVPNSSWPPASSWCWSRVSSPR